jgi:hypothetical protein
MLAAMTSLATLAHPARHAAPAFNGLFWATVATVIPVLFLAIAVQGPFYRDLLQAIAGRPERYRIRGHGWTVLPRQILVPSLSIGLQGIPLLILVYSVLGEVVALDSLARGRQIADPSAGLSPAIFLTFVAVTGPAVTLVTTAYRQMRMTAKGFAWSQDDAAAASLDEQHEPVAGPSEPEAARTAAPEPETAPDEGPAT